ncbi:MAG: tetratricopeptide repeat protein [Pseudoxanthomonas sp.]
MKMLFRTTRHSLLTLSIAALLAGVVVSESAQAQDSQSRSERRHGKDKQQAENRYPDATRKEPQVKPSQKLAKKEQQLIDAFNDSEFEKAKPLADELLANSDASDYDKALVNFLAAQIAYNQDDTAAAKTYAQKAIDLNALGNDNHFAAMQFLAQLQIQDDQYAEALTTLDKYFAETNSKRPEDLVIKGNALYRAERYAEAIPVLKQAIDATPEPKSEWVQLLMASYADAGQNEQAIQLAEQLAAKSPDDKKAQMNLASVYLQADKMDKAAEVLEKLRASGQLTDERDYRQLYTTYANIDGKEKEVISVINEGLQKGVLKPDYQTYVALAQSYYYSDQIPQAIDAWQKGAPLSKDGETYLNLARVLWQENRIPEAKQAAKAALDKGVKKPEDAKKIIALP